MSRFPEPFVQSLSDTFGPELAARVVAALDAPASVSLRYHPFRCPEQRMAGEPIPWNPYGLLLSERPSFTRDPLFHAGCYYVQDSSAMFVGEIFRRCCPEAERVLDLCAAPGGKTTDLAASLRQRKGEAFSLLANEVMRDRYRILRANVRTWADPRVGVISRDPSYFGQQCPGAFDALVADVPCSGEGMFRKDPKALTEWSEDLVAFCAERQRRILRDVWPALAPGGVLIYSTCTFNAQENDNNVAWIAETLGAEVLDPGEGGPGIVRTRWGYALLPGLVPGEGQYVAALRKTAQGRTACGTDPLHLPGVEIPYEALPDAPWVAVDLPTALAYLHGDALRLETAPKGLIVIAYAGFPLGPAKNIGSRCNNLYPKDRRIRMDIR